MRAINDILYKMPPIFTTVIGGLWVFAINFSGSGKLIPCSVFLFASIASLCFVNIVRRFGLAFTGYLNNLNRMDDEYSVSLQQEWGPSTIFYDQNSAERGVSDVGRRFYLQSGPLIERWPSRQATGARVFDDTTDHAAAATSFAWKCAKASAAENVSPSIGAGKFS
jgi:hypothetical protein